MSGDPEALEEQERDNERIRLEEQERDNKLGQEKEEIGNFYERLGNVKGNMPTVGESFGFLIFSESMETKHFEEGSH